MAERKGRTFFVVSMTLLGVVVGGVLIAAALMPGEPAPSAPASASASPEPPQATDDVAADAPLTALLPEADCHNPATHASCDDGVYQPIWKKIVAENGEAVKVQAKKVMRGINGEVMAGLYTYVPGSAFNPDKLQEINFDCRGHFMVAGDASADLEDAPPQSLIGAAARVACAAPAN